MSLQTEERIAFGDILIYASPIYGVFLANALINFYLLKFSTDVLLIAPAVIGTLLLISKIWDAVTDPAAGWLSDRTTSRFGRRRPWMMASAIPLGASIVMLWSPPEHLDDDALTLWVGIAILAFFTAYTAFRVPHIALGAELSRGYHDRTRVFGVLQAVENVGMLSAAGALVLLEQAEDPRAFARTIAWCVSGIALVFTVLATWRIRERDAFQGRGGPNPWRAFRDVLRNPHARILIAVFFLEQLGFGALLALFPYLSDYVIQSRGSTGLYLFAAIISALVSIPLWIHLSSRLGKKRVWIWSIWAKIAIFAAIFSLGEGDFLPMMLLAALFGLMNGCGAVLGPSLKADVVDWDEAETGERKEGAYFAGWNFVQKCAAGVAVWMVGVTLAMTGFQPNVAQSEGTITGMLLLASAAPCVMHLLAVWALARFSLDQAEHRSALARAAARA